MGRRSCCAKEGLNRGAWTAHEDKVLTEYIKVHGEGKWRDLPKRAGLKRCGKSCRLRWLNYLRPDIKRGNISPDEEELIVRLHKLLGNRWSLIAGRLPGRTDNEIKNYWNTILSKKNQVQEASAGSARASLTSADGELPKHKEAKNAMSSPSSLSHNVVIRTKATKCSKVFIDPPLPHNDHHKPVDHQLHKVNDQPSTGNNGLSSSAFSLENSSAFMVDFDTSDELSLPNLLGMDFSCRDPLFSEEMLLQQQYWSGSVGGVEDSVVDHQLQPNMVLNFQSLNIFLEGDADQGEWHALGKST